jgi:hypothetical protein
VIKEIFDVTSYSYMMNVSTPDTYAENLSKNNIYSG